MEGFSQPAACCNEAGLARHKHGILTLTIRKGSAVYESAIIDTIAYILESFFCFVIKFVLITLPYGSVICKYPVVKADGITGLDHSTLSVLFQGIADLIKIIPGPLTFFKQGLRIFKSKIFHHFRRIIKNYRITVYRQTINTFIISCCAPYAFTEIFFFYIRIIGCQEILHISDGSVFHQLAHNGILYEDDICCGSACQLCDQLLAVTITGRCLKGYMDLILCLIESVNCLLINLDLISISSGGISDLHLILVCISNYYICSQQCGKCHHSCHSKHQFLFHVSVSPFIY